MRSLVTPPVSFLANLALLDVSARRLELVACSFYRKLDGLGLLRILKATSRTLRNVVAPGVTKLAIVIHIDERHRRKAIGLGRRDLVAQGEIINSSINRDSLGF